MIKELEYTKQVMPSKVACPPLISVQPVPKQQPPASFSFNLIYLPLILPSVIQYQISLWLVGISCPCCVFSQLLVPSSLLAGGVV